MPLTTILVEDSQTIRDNLIPALEDLVGAEVIAVADSPLEAEKAFDAHGDVWDLAVVDIFLSDGSGLTVLRRCMDRLPHQHVLVLTNYPTAEVRSRCLALGADGVFDKSTQLDEFFAECARYAGA
ncbi:response regulator [Variovorax boronicumulans]|uniref:response regulator n=1 Tax=Variovorax boronicumulans TaxID=436515 RepID=UPI003399DA9F